MKIKRMYLINKRIIWLFGIVLSILFIFIAVNNEVNNKKLEDIKTLSLQLSSEDLIELNKVDKVQDWKKIILVEDNKDKKIKIRAIEGSKENYQLDIDDAIYNMYKLDSNTLMKYAFLDYANEIGLDTSTIEVLRVGFNEVPVGIYILEKNIDEKIRDENNDYFIKLSNDNSKIRKIFYCFNEDDSKKSLSFFDEKKLSDYFALCKLFNLSEDFDFENMLFRYDSESEKFSPYIQINRLGVDLNNINGDDKYTKLENFILKDEVFAVNVGSKINYFIDNGKISYNVNNIINKYKDYVVNIDSKLKKLEDNMESFKKNNLYNVTINEVMVSNNKTNEDEDGDYGDWIEIYNSGSTKVNLKGYGLSDKSEQLFLWKFPDVSISPNEYLLIWATGKDRKDPNKQLHTNFSISKSGDSIYLTNQDGILIDKIEKVAIPSDVSFGRLSDFGSEFVSSERVCLEKPTPGKMNITKKIVNDDNYEEKVSPPAFSKLAGFYNKPFKLELQSEDEECKIYYTLDGSIPSPQSLEYKEPILIESRKGEENILSEIRTSAKYDNKLEGEVYKATIIRASAYKKGLPMSKTITGTYFVGPNENNRYTLPVVSLVTERDNLFDYEKGIYVPGKVYDDWKQENPNSEQKNDMPANYNQEGEEWERDVHIEFFEPQGNLGFSQNAGIRISGGWSRDNAQKSLKIYARSDYDNKNTIDYKIFPNLNKSLENDEIINQYKRIILRNSGQDVINTLFRDALIQSLIKDTNVDIQAYRPTIVFLNGEYWGIHNIREKLDENYLKSHYDIAEGDSVILPSSINWKSISSMSDMNYRNMLNFIDKNDLSNEENKNYIKTQMDVDNFIDYNIVEIYCGNTDWILKNNSFWRKKTDKYVPDAPYGHDGRWRWMIYDTDGGFYDFKYDSLKFATNNEEIVNTNYNSTLILRKLLENEEFRNSFINRFADQLNTALKEENVVNRINGMQNVIAPEILEHISRWPAFIESVGEWNIKVEELREFARNRPEYMRKYILDYFSLSGTSKVILNNLNIEGGTIKINTVKIENQSWEGIYFNNVPIEITALPKEGYYFSGWEGNYNNNSDTLSIKLINDISLTASFVKRND